MLSHYFKVNMQALFTHIEYNGFCFYLYFLLLLFFRGLGRGGLIVVFVLDLILTYKVGVRKLNDCCLFCGLLCSCLLKN